MFKTYLEEYNNCTVIETPFGFIGYNFQYFQDNVKYCMITDIYIDPKHRKHGNAKSLVDQVILIAEENECKFICSELKRDNQYKSQILVSQIKMGFNIYNMDEYTYYLSKEL